MLVDVRLLIVVVVVHRRRVCMVVRRRQGLMEHLHQVVVVKKEMGMSDDADDDNRGVSNASMSMSNFMEWIEMKGFGAYPHACNKIRLGRHWE